MKPFHPGRTIEGVCILASLVGYDIDEQAAGAHLTLDQLRDLEVWAERTHFRASDNPVKVPPRPAWLPDPWKGEPDHWGHGPTVIDCAAIAASTRGA